MVSALQRSQPETFLSTLPARGATASSLSRLRSSSISIHAPREGSDRHGPRPGLVEVISIHAPREGSDLCTLPPAFPWPYFYPRSPRGERPATGNNSLGAFLDFYPRSPRGERRCRPGHQLRGCAISIHAPREGSDEPLVPDSCVGSISIHAPREGSDRAGLS